MQGSAAELRTPRELDSSRSALHISKNWADRQLSEELLAVHRLTFSTARSQGAGRGVSGSLKGQLRCTGPSLPGCSAQRSAASTDVSTRRAGAPLCGVGRSAAHLA